MNRVAFRLALLAPVPRQPLLSLRPLRLGIGARPASSIAEPAFWKSLIPKPLRSRPASENALSKKKPKSNEWNPATFFIIIFLLIGSMSIQMIVLKKDFATFMRQADVRIGLLREVVEKLQRGEKVDVEQVLGTGDPERELQWEEGSRQPPFHGMRGEGGASQDKPLTDTAVLKEIEREDPAKTQRKKQPEPTQPPSPKPDAPPAPEPARGQVQSTLASQGFY